MQGGLGPKLPCNTFGLIHFNHLQISHRPAESVRYFYGPLYVNTSSGHTEYRSTIHYVRRIPPFFSRRKND